MDPFKVGYLDTINTFLDKIFVEGNFIDNYSDAVRSFDLIEKNASKDSPYSMGVSRASFMIGKLGGHGIGYFSCLKEVDGLTKSGSCRSEIVDVCISHLEFGRFSDDDDIDSGFKYACKRVVESEDSAREIARMEFLDGRL